MSQMRTTTEIQNKKALEIERRQRLKDLLLLNTEAENRSSALRDEREHEKDTILLMSGISFDDFRRISHTLSARARTYRAIFSQDFYKQIYRLKGWKIPAGGIAQKPHIVGMYTNTLIYQRFQKEVLPILQTMNPRLATGWRLYKHHQWLTEEGRKELKRFINEAVEMMKQYSTWFAFEQAYCEKHDLPFQLKMEL